MTKEPSYGTPPRVLTCLLTLNLRMTLIGGFFWTNSVLAIFWPLPVAFRIKKKFIKFRTKFQVRQAKFLPFKCTSLLLHGKPAHRNWLHFFKNFKKQYAP